MTYYQEVQIGELFQPQGGKAKYIRDYIESHPGDFPVYSASLEKPFGYVDEFDYEGRFLTWVMNGYGGRVQELNGRFSINRDRGVLLPREGVELPDFTYLRFAMESQLVAAAVGRRVDGRMNEYTKIYRDAASEVTIKLPVGAGGKLDFLLMQEVGSKLRRVEGAQQALRAAYEQLDRATFPLVIPEPSITLSLGDVEHFSLTIGDRVLTSDHVEHGVPVYSANALKPFGQVATSNLDSFERPSLLWGIDGNFDWNFIEAGESFATTDHCGRLLVLNDQLDPRYVYAFLTATRRSYGFDRVFRASLANMKAEVTVTVPLDPNTGSFALDLQRKLAKDFMRQRETQDVTLGMLADVLKSRISTEL
ncbi:MAG: hypothetical protein KJZ64_06790 [Sphingomonadaceae bacterium]|nr:hypothetical protein [Sphingomonadaceae bacterium]